MSDMTDIAIPLIAQFEGLELAPYYCPAFKLTIGYGEVISPNKMYGDVMGWVMIDKAENLRKVSKNRTLLNSKLKDIYADVITAGEARNMLKDTLQSFWRKISNNLPQGLSDNQCGAILSLIYNIGATAFLKSSVLLHIKNGDFKNAGNAFMLYNKARIHGVLTKLDGLTNRRKTERDLFLK